jgi:hypothetical protein
MLVRPSIDSFLPTWRRSGVSEQTTNTTRKHSWVTAAVVDLSEESLMDKSELNFRCQALHDRQKSSPSKPFYSITKPLHPSAATSRSSLRYAPRPAK